MFKFGCQPGNMGSADTPGQVEKGPSFPVQNRSHHGPGQAWMLMLLSIPGPVLVVLTQVSFEKGISGLRAPPKPHYLSRLWPTAVVPNISTRNQFREDSFSMDWG